MIIYHLQGIHLNDCFYLWWFKFTSSIIAVHQTNHIKYISLKFRCPWLVYRLNPHDKNWSFLNILVVELVLTNQFELFDEKHLKNQQNKMTYIWS